MFWQRLRTGILWQFAVTSLVVVVALGVSLGWILGQIVERNALTAAAADARDAVSRRVIEHLSPEDFRSPMTGQRYDDFHRFVQESVVSGRTARIKLWGLDGTVVFSDEASLVGQGFPIEHDLADALKGEVAMHVSDLQSTENLAERQYGRLLEVHVPVVFPDSSEVQGVFEVYQYYEPVARYIEESQRSLYTALALGLLFMYGSLLAVVRRGHNTISQQQDHLAAMVTEKAGLLAAVQERSADLQWRNEQLASLNQAATDLSRCMTSSEVLSTGLRLATNSTGLPAGSIWLIGPADQVHLAEHRGLTAEDAAILAELPRRSPALQQVLRSGHPLLLDKHQVQALLMPADRTGPAPTTALVAPLLSRGDVLGALTLYTTAEGASSKGDANLAQAIGAQIGVTLENARRYEEARYLADRDPVTGLLNHRAFHQRLDQEIKRARRGAHELSVVMMDLDGFKLFNDTYGHPAGDRVLREATALLSQAVRASDVLARYGGDEFAALLPDTGSAGALALAQRFRAAFAEYAFVPPSGPAVPIRMSFGIASSPHDARDGHGLMGIADANLYKSKRQGGDTINSRETPGEEDSMANTGSFGVLDGLVTAVDNKDHYTRQHSEDVTNHAISIAQALCLSDESQRTLRIAGLLHDVGKIGVPDRLLKKPGRLDEEEFSIIKQHASLGEMIVKEVPNITAVVAAVGAHHERFDGKGYPRGQKGEDIPLLGRILAVADAYSAMTTDRPYRKALSPEEARAELLRAAGNQLDPEVVRAFLGILPVRAPAEAVASLSDR